MKRCILLLVLAFAFVLGTGNDGESLKYGILPDQTVILETPVAPAPSLYEPWFAFRGAVWSHGNICISAGDAQVPRQIVCRSAKLVSQYSIPVLSGLLHIEPTQAQILLFSNRNSYASALQAAGIPLKEIPDYVTKSGGVTIGRDISIPLYAWPDSSGLAYTLTHELTHVALAENRLFLPAWLNEGLAWDAGWSVQEQMNPKVIEEYKNRYFEELKDVALDGQLLPLNVEEQDILKAPYNVEWQDYMAVEDLLNTYGKNSLDSFLNQSKRIGSVESFENSFGLSLATYEKRFNQGLEEHN